MDEVVRVTQVQLKEALREWRTDPTNLTLEEAAKIPGEEADETNAYWLFNRLKEITA